MLPYVVVPYVATLCGCTLVEAMPPYVVVP